ncbi:MAG: hypothetical protein KJ621_08470, partial [Proteobacteria bacterium]|nr:hypothetical protein [Pseudomonadota bacterium]
MSFIEIIGKVALGQAVAEVKEKLKTKKYNDQVDAVFNQTLSAFDRIIFLCQKSDDFGREIFNLAEGKSARIDRLFEAAAAYADNPDIQGVEPYLTPSKIQGELREFSHRLLDGFRQVGSAKLGELPQAFNKFDRDINSYSVVDKTPEEKPQGPPPVYLPRMKNTLLQHHEEWIEKIAATLGQEGRAAVGQETVERAAEGLGAAVSGQGGIGKTAMANEYAHAHVADYPGGVFWLQIDLGLAQALREAAQKLGWDIPDSLDDKQVQEMVLAEIRGRSGLKLLILDNLEDQVVPTEANLPGSHLLVTTRRTDVDLPRVKMDLPLENEALDIFLGYAELDRGGISEAEELAAREICDRVGNLPLALEILGKVARKRGLAQTALRLDDIISEKASVHGKGEVLSIGAALALAEGQYGHPRALEALR